VALVQTHQAESTGAVLPTEKNPAEDGQDVTKEERGALQDGYGGLPPELYHYYYGSHADMGTLIEVRRGWDAFIMPGGRTSKDLNWFTTYLELTMCVAAGYLVTGFKPHHQQILCGHRI
jgi:hypothetical protein